MIRNGEQVYRIWTEIDFSPRLIPLHNEIGEKQFIVTDYFRQGSRKVTREDVEFDDHAKAMRDLMTKYNRIVLLIQGLLDRSEVFHPHLPIMLSDEQSFYRHVKLIRDEEIGLPSNHLTWGLTETS